MLHCGKLLLVNGFNGDIAGCLSSAQVILVDLLATELVFDAILSIKPVPWDILVTWDGLSLSGKSCGILPW